MITTMPRPNTTSRARRRMIAALLTGLCVLTLTATGQADDRMPAEPAAAAPGPIVIEWTDSEQGALKVAVSRRGEMAGSALYMLLARASGIGQLSEEQWASLDHVSYANLVGQPLQYAGRPIRLRMYVQVAQRLEAGVDELGTTPDWRQGRVAWRIDAIEADSPTHPDERAVRLFCVTDPTAAFGKPLSIEDDGELVYAYDKVNDGPYVEVAGLFFKTWQAETRQADAGSARANGDGSISLAADTIDVPILIVWQVRTMSPPQPTRLGARRTSLPTMIIMIAVVLAAILFYMLKRTLRQRRRGEGPSMRMGHGEYKPLRDIEADDDPDADGDEEEEAVDPDLAAAAEAYLREREQENLDA